MHPGREVERVDPLDIEIPVAAIHCILDSAAPIEFIEGHSVLCFNELANIAIGIHNIRAQVHEKIHNGAEIVLLEVFKDNGPIGSLELAAKAGCWQL